MIPPPPPPPALVTAVPALATLSSRCGAAAAPTAADLDLSLSLCFLTSIAGMCASTSERIASYPKSERFSTARCAPSVGTIPVMAEGSVQPAADVEVRRSAGGPGLGFPCGKAL
jgi:hypothetical protein